MNQLRSENESINIPNKAAAVIFNLSKENVDIRAVAKSMGFRDHREMASYMRSKGYVWDPDMNNYKVEKQEKQIESATEIEDAVPMEGSYPTINRYLPILEILARNKEKLTKILVEDGAVESASIPRYIIPGVYTTKSVHMVSKLDNMIKDFSKEKNISQREIFEVALIQFFMKYGYEREVRELLGS